MTDYDLTKPTQRKIKERMDKLQEWMESNYHLENPEEVEILIDSVAKFWNVMQEEDTDYIHGARHAIENKIAWNLS
jgi:DNA-binding phage protein